MKQPSKRIAERFTEMFGSNKTIWLDHNLQSIFQWINKQPENTKLYTIEQVEQVAREAFALGTTIFIRSSVGFARAQYSISDFDEAFWNNKKQELEK